MTNDEFLQMLDEDEFLSHIKLLREESRKDLRFDFENRLIGSCSNCDHNREYSILSGVMDKYIYFLEKKYKIGRGSNDDK